MKADYRQMYRQRVMTTLICILFCLTTHLQAQNDSDRTQRMRKWTDTQNRQTIRAKLMDVQDDGLVTLRDKDGQQFRIETQRLSTSDKKFIDRYRSKLNVADAKDQPAQNHILGNSNSAKADGWRSIQWNPANQMAKISDKPVFWFRVLGQLEGGM